MPQVTHMNPDPIDDDFDHIDPPDCAEPTPLAPPEPADDDRERDELADRRHDLGGEG